MSIQATLPELRELVALSQPARHIEAAMRLVLVSFTGQNRYGNHEPMAVHSLRVGLQLSRFGNDLTTVLGGYCHDLIEDTKVTEAIVTELFGAEVCELVLACTQNDALYESDSRPVNEDLIRRVAAYGARAVAIKIVDSTDNLATLHQVDVKWHEEMLWCGDEWLNLGRKILGEHAPHVMALEAMLARVRPQ